MKPRITLITLGLTICKRTVRFYRDGLGLETEGIVGTEFEHGAVALFELQSGLMLWPRRSIAHDTGVPIGSPSSTDFTLGHNVAGSGSGRGHGAGRAGGRRSCEGSAPHFLGWLPGYFQDPDGHLWEVAWNPQWTLQE
jgi:catechol 2,3-dioxygenase-like lactoylglutathione lyase family enzyme